MACACKVNRDISYLQKRYGVKSVVDKKETHIRQDAKVFLEKIGIFIITLPFIPVLFVWTIFRALVNKNPINISKLFRIQHVG